MVELTFEELRRNPDDVLRRVRAGEHLLVVDADRPLFEIHPLLQPSPAPRQLGLCAGEFVVPEDFDSPLPDEVIAAFEGR
jgi:antitoxin (DNA-binding transcriptional repressor) of toxin-antitoxin stability system